MANRGNSNRDPIEEKGGANLYAMCGNNPICKYDLWGMVDSSQPHWDNFITIESKIAKYKKKWYKFAFGSPYLEIDITGKGRLKRFENCGELYSVQYTIVPAGGRKAFNTLGRKDDPYRLWDGDQVRTNFGWRNRFRYMVDVEFYVDGEVTRDNLWELVPNMDGNWTWDTIASKTLVRPITSGSVSLTVTVFLRNVLMDANVFTSVSDSNIVLRDHYEIEN